MFALLGAVLVVPLVMFLRSVHAQFLGVRQPGAGLSRQH